MKKVMVMLAAVCIAFAGLADSTGATTNWVARFVADYVGKAISNSTAQISAGAQTQAQTNGASTVTLEAGGYDFKLTFEPLDQPALIAHGVTVTGSGTGITNGFMWAWSDQGQRYVNIATDPIIPTTTNFTWRGVGSEADGSKTWIVNAQGTRLYEVLFTQIQLTTAKELKGEN